MPIGPADSPTGSVAWPQVLNSPVMFNTVRRMTDVDLTILPLSKITFRFGYSKVTMEGPALSPVVTASASYPMRCSSSISAMALTITGPESTGNL